LTITEKYYIIAVCKNFNICIRRSVRALIVKVDESVCLDIKTNKAKKFVSKYPKKSTLLQKKRYFVLKVINSFLIII
jgi:hypothetical protein